MGQEAGAGLGLGFRIGEELAEGATETVPWRWPPAPGQAF